MTLSAAALAVALAACDRPSGPPAPPRSDAARVDPPALARAPDRDAPAPAAPTSRGNDAATTARVKAALAAEPQVRGVAIDVNTRAGVVTLQGAVDRDDQVTRAVAIARGVEGVQNVVNRLTVKSEDKAAHSSRG